LNRDDEKEQKKQHPFEFISDEEFERIFREMQRFIDSDSFRDMVEDILRDNIQQEDHIIHGITSKSKPYTRGIDEIPCDSSEEPLPDEIDQEPFADIIKDEQIVSVTIALPDVQKKDIRVRMSSQDLEIIINRNGTTWYDSIELSALVDPETAIASFNNGILDVTVERKHLYDQGKKIDIM
jgi:HSP20 family protein